MQKSQSKFLRIRARHAVGVAGQNFVQAHFLAQKLKYIVKSNLLDTEQGI